MTKSQGSGSAHTVHIIKRTLDIIHMEEMNIHVHVYTYLKPTPGGTTLIELGPILVSNTTSGNIFAMLN